MTDEELRELQERVQQILDMTETRGWILLQDAAIGTLQGRQNRIVQGRCENMEDYKAEVSFTNGMRYILNLPATLQSRLEQELQIKRESEGEEVEELEEVV